MIVPVLLLTLPVLWYEVYVRSKSMYLSHVNQYYSSSIVYLFLFTFTCLVIICSLLFFTFETLESSYYDQREEYNINPILIQDLQNEILNNCIQRDCAEQDLVKYISDHVKSIYKLGGDIKKKHVISQVLSMLKNNQAFERIDQGNQLIYHYKYGSLKPLNINKYIISYHWHDRVQTFFKRVTKGFGLTHD